jgi:hypothetical protein
MGYVAEGEIKPVIARRMPLQQQSLPQKKPA